MLLKLVSCKVFITSTSVRKDSNIDGLEEKDRVLEHGFSNIPRIVDGFRRYSQDRFGNNNYRARPVWTVPMEVNEAVWCDRNLRGVVHFRVFVHGSQDKRSKKFGFIF